MKLNERELAKLYQEHTRRQPETACPPAEDLTRLAMNELNETDRDRLADHLSACKDCSEEFQIALELKSFAPAPAPELGTVRKPSWLERLGLRFQLPIPAYGVALVLLIIPLALVGWVSMLRQENARLAEISAQNQSSVDAARRRAEQAESQIASLEKNLNELSRPQFNIPITDLVPMDASRGPGNESIQKIELPAGTNFFTVILNVTGKPSFADYAFQVVDAQGQTIQEGRGLRKSAENTFTVALSRRLMPAGSYEFRLQGVTQDGSTLVQAYKVQLRYQ
jgi:hypothetical protein